jgi:hypothetical protein
MGKNINNKNIYINQNFIIDFWRKIGTKKLEKK